MNRIKIIYIEILKIILSVFILFLIFKNNILIPSYLSKIIPIMTRFFKPQYQSYEIGIGLPFVVIFLLTLSSVICLIFFLFIMYKYKRSESVKTKVLFAFLFVFIIHLFFIGWIVLSCNIKYGFYLNKIINTFLTLLVSTSQIYFPLLIMISLVVLINSITKIIIIAKEKEVTND